MTPNFPISATVAIVICVLLSACFSGVETALTSLTERGTLQLMERGGSSASILKTWRDQPNRVLSTLLVGNNIVNIAASVFSVRVSAWALQAMGSTKQGYIDAAAVVFTTLVLLLFAEITPKTFARHNAIRLAIPSMQFVRLFEIPLFPIAWVFSKVAKAIVTLLGGSASRQGPPVTEEDIEYMIELGARESVFEQKERAKLLEAALEFGDTLVKEIMIPRTKASSLDVQTSAPEALEKLIAWGHSRVPIYRGSIDKVEGTLYAKDLLKAVSKPNFASQTIEPFMRTQTVFVPATQKIASTLKEMQHKRVHLAVVLDEFGGFSGIITVEDILEELVGEIRDEYDREEDLVKPVGDRVFLANAAVSIADLGEMLNVEFPDDGQYETLGGFFVATHGCVPSVGTTCQVDDLELEVTKADDRHVEQVRITRGSTPPDGLVLDETTS